VTANKTTAAIESGETSQLLPEFGRIGDVERLFALKRGILYQLIAARKVKSVCLRKPGAKTGVRLVNLSSVRAFLSEQME
jgi:hypothetical protein